MTVDFICVTNRPEFAPVVLAQFCAQTCEKRLIVVEAAESPGMLQDAADDYAMVKPDTPVGTMRNIGAQFVLNERFFWLDDDDWRHPEFVQRMLYADGQVAGLRSSYWINTEGEMRHRGTRDWPLFAACLYSREHGIPPFRPKKIKTDTYWLHRVRERYPLIRLSDRADNYVIVCHGDNVHNPTLLGSNVPCDEMDERFLPHSEDGLHAHMERIREACRGRS